MTDSFSGIIDIAANLTDKVFEKDLDAVIDRAQQAGVFQMIVTGCDIEESESAVLLTEKFDCLYSTAGVHPHYAKDTPDDYLNILKALAEESKVKALGEAGLDFNRNFSPPKRQIKVFEEQLELACESRMPILMHQRDAHQQFAEMVKHHRDDLSRGVLHCFTGTKDELYACLDLDLYIGITGWICDERRGQHLIPLLKDIPSDRLMIETDAPYLLPRTLKPKPKSRRNEPAYLRHICEQMADILGISTEQLAEQTTENAKTFFDIN